MFLDELFSRFCISAPKTSIARGHGARLGTALAVFVVMGFPMLFGPCRYDSIPLTLPRAELLLLSLLSLCPPPQDLCVFDPIYLCQ